MNTYLASLALGLLAGVIYGLFSVRSPAPPVVALLGLLGMLIGEQIPPLVKQVFQREIVSTSCLEDKVAPHMFGQMPGCPTRNAEVPDRVCDTRT